MEEKEYNQSTYIAKANSVINWVKNELDNWLKDPHFVKICKETLGEQGIAQLKELKQLNVGGVCSGLVNKWLEKFLDKEVDKFFRKLDLDSQLSLKLESYLENISFDVAIKDTDLIKILKFAQKIVLLQQQTERLTLKNKEKVHQENLSWYIPVDYSAKTFLVVTKEMLAESLGRLKQNRIYRIGAPGHILGLVIENGKYTVYDPNDPDGQKTFSSAKKLANYVFDDAFDYLTKDHKNLTFRIYTYHYQVQDREALAPMQKDLATLKKWLRENPIERKDIQQKLIYLLNSIDDGQKPFEETARKIFQILKMYSNLFKELPKLNNLIQFIKNNHESIDLTENLIDKFSVTSKGTDGYSALFYVIEQGNLDLVEKMYDRGANLNFRGNGGFTPLHWAVTFDKPKIVEFLVRKGASLNKANDNGDIPLTYAVSDNNYDMVKHLIKLGADVNKKNKKGESPIDYAFPNPRLVKLLIKNDANITNTIETAELLKDSFTIPLVKDKSQKKFQKLFEDAASLCQKEANYKKSLEFLEKAAQLGSEDAIEKLLDFAPRKMADKALKNVVTSFVLEKLQDVKESLNENKKYFIYKNVPKHKQKIDTEIDTLDYLINKITKIYNKDNNPEDIQRELKITHTQLRSHLTDHKIELTTSGLLQVLKNLATVSPEDILKDRKGFLPAQEPKIKTKTMSH